jgi:hypothetical protein
MYHRIFISSENVPASSLPYSIANYTSLNDFAGKAIYIGLEWLTPSYVNTDFKFDLDHPNNGLVFVLTNITSHNQATSLNGSGSILALLPGYAGNWYYGVCCDSPYVQTFALPIVSHGNDLLSRSSLDFEFLSTGTLADGSVTSFKPALMRDWSASLVFWTVQPERPLTPHDHFHIWLSCSDRSSGTVANCTITVDLTTFSMHSKQYGAWYAAVSFISPIFHNVNAVANLASGLALMCDDFRTSRYNQPALCFFNRTHVLGKERYYGRRMSIKPVNSDTIGVPLHDSIDNLASLRLRLVDPLTMEPPTNLDEFWFSNMNCRNEGVCGYGVDNATLERRLVYMHIKHIIVHCEIVRRSACIT